MLTPFRFVLWLQHLAKSGELQDAVVLHGRTRMYLFISTIRSGDILLGASWRVCCVREETKIYMAVPL